MQLVFSRLSLMIGNYVRGHLKDNGVFLMTDTPQEAKQHKEDKTSSRQVYYIITALVSFGLVVAVCIFYTNYAVQKSNDNWCELMVPLGARNKQIPQKTEDQKFFTERIHNLTVKLNCDGGP